MTREGDRVYFRISDVFLPGQEEMGIATPTGEEAELEGTVVGFSDSGSELRVFAVVKVVRSQNFVVPTAKLRNVGSNNSDEEC